MKDNHAGRVMNNNNKIMHPQKIYVDEERGDQQQSIRSRRRRLTSWLIIIIAIGEIIERVAGQISTLPLNR
jgi:hypothetical protein